MRILLDVSETQVEFKVVSKSAEQRIVYGWAYCSKDADGEQVVDHSGEVIKIDELRKGARLFMREQRASGEMHEGVAENVVVESIVVTDELVKAMPDVFVQNDGPRGWLIGVEVNAETFKRVADGSRLMFSIQGQTRRRAAS